MARHFQWGPTMSCRITITAQGQPSVVKVDGRLRSQTLPELSRVCEELRTPFVIDLTDLQFADRDSVRVLRSLRAKGADLVGTPRYLELLLDSPAEDSRG